jgi:hypothetical protein
VPLTVIPLVHGIELPAVRLWDVIVYCGGMAGEKVTFPVNPALVQVPFALFVSVPTRLGTLQ